MLFAHTISHSTQTDQKIYQQAKESVDHLFSILKSANKSCYIGENVSQLAHALQCAYEAQIRGGSEELILACLFHDIGHQLGDAKSMGGFGVADHENIGANFIAELGFSHNIAEIVRAHIDAKRYLICKDPTYYDGLSDGSKQTFKYQGEPMSPEEAEAFEQDPLFEQKLTMRKCEECAKTPNRVVPALQTYYEMAVEHLYQALINKQ